MNIISFLNRVNAMGRYLLLAVLVMNFLSLVAAEDTGTQRLCEGMRGLCRTSQAFLGAAMMVMIILAGATYAIGQILGAETRARASVWATAMLTGAIIGALIYIIAPMVISRMIGETEYVSLSDANDPCSFTCAEA
jgi:hypothetical protein